MFGATLENGLNRGGAMAGRFLDCVVSDGGESTKASDKDKDDDDTVCFDIPLPNRKAGSRLSTDGR